MSRIALILILITAAGLSACNGDPTLPQDAPAGHTVNKGGAAHRPGLSDPLENCASCHGADLTGGDSGEPGCFSCHGQKW